MTDPDYTHIVMLVDRSGSMAAICEDTEGGVNQFIKDQCAEPGRLSMELIQFDHMYERVFLARTVGVSRRMTPVPFKLKPRGSTALLDAMGRAITETGREIANQSEEERPGKVIVVIATDGQENSSTVWKRDAVFDLVSQQQEVYGWDFIYLGANQDAIAEATKLGIPIGNSMEYDGNTVVVGYSTVGQTVSGIRRGESVPMPDHASEVSTP